VFRNPQLEPDDYRYLEQVRLLRQDFLGNISRASVIENKWDQLWWIDVHEKVRFFRPIVVLSYWLDIAIHGNNDPLSLLSTNILIYSTCVILVCLILYRWIGQGLPFFASCVLFSAFVAHGEVMWYVAGRTDSLAALFLLSGLTLHIYGKQRPALRWWAVPCFVFSLLTKELTAFLPLILILSDLWIEIRAVNVKALLKQEWKLYATYVVIAASFFAIRLQFISGSDTGYPYPYFVTLRNPNFLSHLFGQLNSYCANLLFAIETIPFKVWTDFELTESLSGAVPGIAIFVLCSVFLIRERKYWILVLVGLVSWVPIMFVYQSERYLFLPSFAVAGAAGLFLAELNHRKWKIYYPALLLCIVWMGHQAYFLQAKNKNISELRLAERIGRQLRDLKPSIVKGSKLLLLNLPGDILQDQFIEDQLRVQLDDPKLDVTVVTPMPELFDMGTNMTVSKEGENTFILTDTPVMVHGEDHFPWVKLDTASKYTTRSGIIIEVLEAEEDACEALRCVLPHRLSDYILLKWDPAPSTTMLSANTASIRTPNSRKLLSKVQILTP
jgi:hypothetical protein